MDKYERLAEAKRLLSWCTTHRTELEEIFGIIEGIYEPDCFSDVIRDLDQEELYPMIVFIFLGWWRRRDSTLLAEYMDTLALERLQEIWGQGQADRLTQCLIDDIEEYMGEWRRSDRAAPQNSEV